MVKKKEHEMDSIQEAVLNESDSVITIDAQDNIQTNNELMIVRQELKTSQFRKRLLSGRISGLERAESGLVTAIVDYKGFRVVIPMDEMMIMENAVSDSREVNLRRSKLLSGMLGAEIDFVVRGVSDDETVAVASRKDAMLIKRKKFYVDRDENGAPVIQPGQIVQARILSVHEKGIYIEAFGLECNIFNRDLSWNWLGDARDKFATGDRLLVRIKTVEFKSDDVIEITADAKSVQQGDNFENLKKCKVQSRYAGTVVDIVRGMPYIRLLNGANAIAHTCIDRRTPGKKDEVSFVVTNIDERKGVAMGVITRIIKQNI